MADLKTDAAQMVEKAYGPGYIVLDDMVVTKEDQLLREIYVDTSCPVTKTAFKTADGYAPHVGWGFMIFGKGSTERIVWLDTTNNMVWLVEECMGKEGGGDPIFLVERSGVSPWLILGAAGLGLWWYFKKKR